MSENAQKWPEKTLFTIQGPQLSGFENVAEVVLLFNCLVR